MTNQKALEDVFSKHPAIDSVIHFAALKAVGESGEIPLDYYKVNVQGTLTLLTAAKNHGVTNIVYSSSATVYGDADSTCQVSKITYATGVLTTVIKINEKAFFHEPAAQRSCTL